jgi:hypothetical protein
VQQDVKPTPTPRQPPKVLHSHGLPEVIVISDDSDPEQNVQPSKKHAMRGKDDRPSKRHASTPEVIEIIDSSDDEPAFVKTEEKHKLRPDPGSNSHFASEGPPKDASGRIIVTRKTKVDTVEHLQGVPARWPVPAVDTAYVLDFSNDVPGNSETKNGKPKGLDAFLKAEVCDNEVVVDENPDLAEGSGLLGERDEWQYDSRSEVDTVGRSSCASLSPHL